MKFVFRASRLASLRATVGLSRTLISRILATRGGSVTGDKLGALKE